MTAKEIREFSNFTSPSFDPRDAGYVQMALVTMVGELAAQIATLNERLLAKAEGPATVFDRIANAIENAHLGE